MRKTTDSERTESNNVKRLALAIVIALASNYVGAAESGNAPLQLKQTISLSGVEGRIDHMALDAASDRLFVCALGNNTVEVLDLRKGERIHSITGLGAPQGIAYIPELDRIFIANDKGGICKIYDGKSFQAVGELDFKDDADNVRYDKRHQTDSCRVWQRRNRCGQRARWKGDRVN